MMVDPTSIGTRTHTCSIQPKRSNQEESSSSSVVGMSTVTMTSSACLRVSCAERLSAFLTPRSSITITGPTIANSTMQTNPGMRNRSRPATTSAAERKLAATSLPVGSPRRTSPIGRSSSPFWSTATMRSTIPAKNTRLSIVPAMLSAVPDVQKNVLSRSDCSA